MSNNTSKLERAIPYLVYLVGCPLIFVGAYVFGHLVTCEKEPMTFDLKLPTPPPRNAEFFHALIDVITNPQTTSYGVLAERIRLVNSVGVQDPLLLELQSDYYYLCRLCDQQGWSLQDGAFSIGGAIIGLLDPEGTADRVAGVVELQQRIAAKMSILGPRYSQGGW